MLLALDLSTVSTGFAFGDGTYPAPKVGVWKLPGARDDVLDRTLAVLSESILSLCHVIGATRVAIEAMIPQKHEGSSSHTQAALAQLTGAARAAAYAATKRSVSLHAVASVRKHFCGQGFPENPKKAVIDRCRLLGWNIEQHDCADAAALWAFDMALNCPKWAPRSTPLFAGARA